MTDAKHRGTSRSTGLTRDRIVDAAIEILDADGEGGLTFRALALRLKTGHGAIQWHLANKRELLAAATVEALNRALAAPVRKRSPRSAIRQVGLDVFTAIDAHPWLGPQLSTVPWQPAMVGLWERIGRPVEELGVRRGSLFTAVSTLVGYIVGVGSQNAVNAHSLGAHTDRDEFVDAVAAHWRSLDPVEHPFVSGVAEQLRAHDDRDEFLAGLDIIVTGLEATARTESGR